jgi:hypothetical protein
MNWINVFWTPSFHLIEIVEVDKAFQGSVFLAAC